MEIQRWFPGRLLVMPLAVNLPEAAKHNGGLRTDLC
jgi:hypothetical protein